MQAILVLVQLLRPTIQLNRCFCPIDLSKGNVQNVVQLINMAMVVKPVEQPIHQSN